MRQVGHLLQLKIAVNKQTAVSSYFDAYNCNFWIYEIFKSVLISRKWLITNDVPRLTVWAVKLGEGEEGRNKGDENK